MNNKLLFGGLVVIAVLVGGFVGYHFAPQLGGDFAGGIVPSQLFTAATSTNSVTPIEPNLYLTGGTSVGGVGANNQIPLVYTAVATYPGASSLSIPSGASPSSSATSTTVAFTASGFAVGDPCEVQYNFSTSTLITSANVSAVSGSAVSTTVSFLNANGAAVTAAVTSTITGVSSTLKVTCFATGV